MEERKPDPCFPERVKSFIRSDLELEASKLGIKLKKIEA